MLRHSAYNNRKDSFALVFPGKKADDEKAVRTAMIGLVNIFGKLNFDSHYCTKIIEFYISNNALQKEYLGILVQRWALNNSILTTSLR